MPDDELWQYNIMCMYCPHTLCASDLRRRMRSRLSWIQCAGCLCRCTWCSVRLGLPRDKDSRRVRTWQCWCVRRQTLSSHTPARSLRWSSPCARRQRHTSSWSRIRRRQRPAGGSPRPISVCAHGLSRLLFRPSSCV